MSVQELSVAELSETERLNNHLITADGVTLFAKGERIDAKRIKLILSCGFDVAYSVTGIEDVHSVKQTYRFREIPTIDANPEFILAEATKTADGKPIFAKGRKCDQHTLDTLLKHNVETVRVDIGTGITPQSEQFLEAKKAFLAAEGAAKQRKKRTPVSQARGGLCHLTVQTFLDSWSHTCQTLATLECRLQSPSLGFGEDDLKYFTWVSQIKSIGGGDEQYWILLTLEETTVRHFVKKALSLPDDKIDDSIVSRFALSLSNMFFDEAVRTAPRLGCRIELSPPVSLSDQKGSFDLSFTQALSIPMKVPGGEVAMVFGCHELVGHAGGRQLETLCDLYTI